MMAHDESNPTFASLFTRGAGARRARPSQRDERAPQLDLLFAAEPEPTDPMEPEALEAPTSPAQTAGSPIAQMPAEQARSVWTVRALVSDVRQRVETRYADVWVEGEVSNLRSAPSGHIYFTLKDGDAQLAVVLFRRQAMLLRFAPEDGMAVLVRGRVSVYENRGQLQLIAETAEPRGAGALQIAFEQLKAKLAAEGLFDAARKRALPAFPRRVGVITATSGAVIHDIVSIVARRSGRLGIVIWPAAVQGESCAAEVVAGLRYFNENAVAQGVDLILISRGGGSAEDLAGFNDEGMARAIADSALPVISAIGHETDFTIADFVADLRAATPSAAAELITASQHRIEEHVAELSFRLGRAARYRLMQARQRLSDMSADAVFARLADGFSRRQQRVDELRYQLEAAWQRCGAMQATRLRAATERLHRQDVGRRIAALRAEWQQLAQRLAQAPQRMLREHEAALRTAAARLESLSPLAVLNRGYALVFDERGTLIRSAAQTPVSSIITTRLAEGSLQSKVIMTTRKNHHS